MYHFKVIKSENDIMDICVSYGLGSIFEFNDIEFTLKDEGSMYSIYTDEFDLDEIIFEDLPEIKPINVNSNVLPTEYQKRSCKINEYMNNNIVDVLNHYLGIKQINKTDSAVDIGTRYYSKGCRGKNPTSCKINICDSYLSYIGYIKGMSCIKEGKDKKIKSESSMLLKPKNTRELNKVISYEYTNKETGEVKGISIFDMSSVALKAKLYLDVLKRNKLIADEYDKVYFMEYIATANKNISSVTTTIQTYKISNETIEWLYYLVNLYDKSDLDIVMDSANMTLNINSFYYLNKFIKRLNSNSKTIKESILKELISMQNDVVQEIYNNEVVKKLGQALYITVKEKVGYNTRTKLYNVKSKIHLQKAIFSLMDDYTRLSIEKYRVLTDEELNCLLSVIDNNKKAEICATAILSYSICYKENKLKEGKVDINE